MDPLVLVVLAAVGATICALGLGVMIGLDYAADVLRELRDATYGHDPATATTDSRAIAARSGMRAIIGEALSRLER